MTDIIFNRQELIQFLDDNCNDTLEIEGNELVAYWYDSGQKHEQDRLRGKSHE